MIYVLYSSIQKSFLKREVNKIIKSTLEEKNDFNFAKLDAKENTVDEIINACLEVPFIENKKVVVVDNAFFLSSSKTKEKINTLNDYDKLVKYLSNPIEEIELIFLVYQDKLDARSKIYKAIENNAKFISFSPLKENDWLKYVSQILEKKNLMMSLDGKRELSRRTLNDRDRLLNEIDKLSLYSENITLNDVVTLVSEPLEEKAFELTNALLKGDLVEAMFIYKDLLIKNNEPNLLLIMIANQFRFLYKINYLYKQGNSVTEIANLIKEKDFRIKISLTNANKYYKYIPYILNDIYKLDYKIKSSQIDRFIGFELFLINFKNKYTN